MRQPLRCAQRLSQGSHLAAPPPRRTRAGSVWRRPDREFTLRGVEDSPPYLHDGRLLTLDDTVEFFKVVLGLKLEENEKRDLVAFLLCL